MISVTPALAAARRSCWRTLVVVSGRPRVRPSMTQNGHPHALVTGMHAGNAVAAWLGGDATALPNYVARVHMITAAYQRNRLHSYAFERRWPNRSLLDAPASALPRCSAAILTI